MGRFGSMIGESQLNDWGKPAQSWGRASSMIGESQLNDVGEQPQSWGRASSIMAESSLNRMRTPHSLAHKWLRTSDLGVLAWCLSPQRSRSELVAVRASLLRNSLRVHFHSVLNLERAVRRPSLPVVPQPC